MMCLSALALSFSACNDDDEIIDPNGGNNPKPVKLATPAVTAQGGEETFTAKWAAIDNAEGYTVEVNGQAENVTATEITKTVAAGEYTIRVKATTTKEGYLESDWGEAKATVTEKGGEQPQPGGDEFDGTWGGTWKVSSSQILTFTDQGTEIIDEPSEFELTFTENEFQDQNGQPIMGYIHQGWSQITNEAGEFAPGAALPQDNQLALLSDFKIDEFEDPEIGLMEMVWLAPSIVNGDNSQVTFITGGFPAFTLTMTDNAHASVEPFQGQLQGGGDFEVIAFDIFALAGNQIYFMSEPNFACGEFSMVKVADAKSAPQKAFAKNFKAPQLVNLVKAHTTVTRIAK